ncbi:MAG: hypothetical protein FJY85_20065 [Deltaproteobacteria bacterium]|nr:hypothetical protein [Deltaproteobacteria bacterium]
MKTISPKLLLLLTPLLFTSCEVVKTQRHGGLEPVYPAVVFHRPWIASPVDSLQPTLSWKGPASGAESYDLIVYSGVRRESRTSFFYIPGLEVYYREAIKGTSHRLEQALQPGAVYVWAVRTRTGTQTGRWSTYDYQKGDILSPPIMDLADEKGRNLWWRFRTPWSQP